MEDLTNLLATVNLVPSVRFSSTVSQNRNFERQLVMLCEFERRLACYSLFYSRSELLGPVSLRMLRADFVLISN